MSDPSGDPAVPAVETRLTRDYGLQHPFVGAAMGFIAHEQLAAAVTKAGGLGVLGAGAPVAPRTDRPDLKPQSQSRPGDELFFSAVCLHGSPAPRFK